jgi:hypothetical protein
MPRFTFFAVVLAAVLVMSPNETLALEWESIKTANGTVKNTVTKSGKGNQNRGNKKGGKKSNYKVKPVYVPFATQGKGFRVKFETKGVGERPNLKVELEIEVTRNGKSDWRRVGVVGRVRGDGRGGTSHATGPGNYRIVMTGQNVQYNITIESPVKK